MGACFSFLKAFCFNFLHLLKTVTAAFCSAHTKTVPLYTVRISGQPFKSFKGKEINFSCP